MVFQPNQVLLLMDNLNRRLGQVTIERVEGNLVLGQFEPGPDYPAVEQLFAEYIEAANEQLLSVVGDLDATIRQLGLRLFCPGVAPLPAIDDVQIGMGRVNFRIRDGKTPRPAMTGEVEIHTVPMGR
jgi:hypothetical protein